MTFPAATDTEKNASAALNAAEEAAVPVLSYDYRTFDDDIVDAESLMTTAYAAEHASSERHPRATSRSRRRSSTAEFKGSAVVRVTGDRADILVLVNQVTDKADSDDFVLPVWATLQMVQQDGTLAGRRHHQRGSVGS